MPQVTVEIDIIEGESAYSEIQYKGGLLELVDVVLGDTVDDVVTVQIDELINPEAAEVDQIWSYRWHTPSGADGQYFPVGSTTLADGSAGTGEAHIPLRNPWRIAISGDATMGSVMVVVSLDQG